MCPEQFISLHAKRIGRDRLPIRFPGCSLACLQPPAQAPGPPRRPQHQPLTKMSWAEAPGWVPAFGVLGPLLMVLQPSWLVEPPGLDAWRGSQTSPHSPWSTTEGCPGASSAARDTHSRHRSLHTLLDLLLLHNCELQVIFAQLWCAGWVLSALNSPVRTECPCQPRSWDCLLRRAHPWKGNGNAGSSPGSVRGTQPWCSSCSSNP